MTRLVCGGAVCGPRILLHDVPPQQSVICHPPGVLPLPQRYPELLLSLDKLLEVRLAYLHQPSIGRLIGRPRLKRSKLSRDLQDKTDKATGYRSAAQSGGWAAAAARRSSTGKSC